MAINKVKELLKRFKNWIIRPINAVNAILIVFIISAIMLNIYNSKSSIDQISDPSSAITILNTYAIVSATLTGFLIVAFIFVYQKRISKENPFEFNVVNFDLILFGSSIILFAIAAFDASEKTIKVLVNADNNFPIDTGLIFGPVIIAKFGYILLAIAFGWMVGVNQAERKVREANKKLNRKKP